jgi:hypothetical protein
VLLPDAALPPSSDSFGEPPVDVSALYQPSTAWTVVGLGQEERVRPRDGLVIPTIAVSFTVPPFPGVFTIRIDNYAFTHADVREYMDERAYLIRSLYALPERLPDYAAASGSEAVAIADLEAAAEDAALAALGGVVG